MNVIAWLEFEFASHDVAVQYISHYAPETTPEVFTFKQFCIISNWILKSLNLVSERILSIVRLYSPNLVYAV